MFHYVKNGPGMRQNLYCRALEADSCGISNTLERKRTHRHFAANKRSVRFGQDIGFYVAHEENFDYDKNKKTMNCVWDSKLLLRFLLSFDHCGSLDNAFCICSRPLMGLEVARILNTLMYRLLNNFRDNLVRDKCILVNEDTSVRLLKKFYTCCIRLENSPVRIASLRLMI